MYMITLTLTLVLSIVKVKLRQSDLTVFNGFLLCFALMKMQEFHRCKKNKNIVAIGHVSFLVTEQLYQFQSYQLYYYIKRFNYYTINPYI